MGGRVQILALYSAQLEAERQFEPLNSVESETGNLA